MSSALLHAQVRERLQVQPQPAGDGILSVTRTKKLCTAKWWFGCLTSSKSCQFFFNLVGYGNRQY